jgi:hypothetical protein
MHSPRKSESIIPGEFSTTIPCLEARPDLEQMAPAWPDGISIARPVGIVAMPPGGIVSGSSKQALRSAPALPGVLYNGRDAPWRNLRTLTRNSPSPA